jgi:hypothetical protein
MFFMARSPVGYPIELYGCGQVVSIIAPNQLALNDRSCPADGRYCVHPDDYHAVPDNAAHAASCTNYPAQILWCKFWVTRTAHPIIIGMFIAASIDSVREIIRQH